MHYPADLAAVDDLFDTLADDSHALFKPLNELLGAALLASYLLGQDQIQRLTVDRRPPTAVEFAEDEEAKGKGKKGKRKPAIDARFDVPPAEAIDYFERKQIIRKREFNRLTREARQGAFTVGGVYRDDVLEGFKSELESALRSGATQQETIKRFKGILDGAGHRSLGEFHLETVFRANMGTAYGVGRRRGMEAVSDAFPLWQYRGVGDDRERPRHRALEGITLPADNPFWDSHYPPWEFNCRCSALPTDELPDGYDARNPSGERDEYGEPVVQLSYDKYGAPAKAEIGTSLVDLQVGNFSGVPRGASLLSAIEAGVKRAGRARGKGERAKGKE